MGDFSQPLLICKMGIISGPTSWECWEIQRHNPNEVVSAVPDMASTPQMLAVITHETFAEPRLKDSASSSLLPSERERLGYMQVCPWTAGGGSQGGQWSIESPQTRVTNESRRKVRLMKERPCGWFGKCWEWRASPISLSGAMLVTNIWSVPSDLLFILAHSALDSGLSGYSSERLHL